MMLQQKLQTRLVQKLILTPSLQQAIKLLPMTTLELSDMLNQEVVENPMLEEVPTEELQPAEPAFGCRELFVSFGTCLFRLAQALQGLAELPACRAPHQRDHCDSADQGQQRCSDKQAPFLQHRFEVHRDRLYHRRIHCPAGISTSLKRWL